MNLSVPGACDCHMMILCNRLIELCDFFDCRARVEALARDWFARCIHACDKKQIIDDSGESFAFGDGGFDGLSVLGSCAVASESHLRLAQHIGDWCSQLVREV